jgi:Mn-dependent DtxR family transcriptional regulator
MRPIDVAKLLGVPEETRCKIIDELMNMGIIKRTRRGKYEWWQ